MCVTWKVSENQSGTEVKAVKTDFTQGLLHWGKRGLSIELGSIPNITWRSGDFSQGAEWGAVDGKFLRGNIGAGGVLAKTDLTGFLLKAGQ